MTGAALPATTTPPPAKWAEALAVLANSLIKGFLRTSATEDNIALAQMAVDKALAIDPSLPLAHLAQARICRAKGDHQGALKACDEALGHDSTLTEASMQKAFALVFLGRPKEALETAINLDLRDADPGDFYWLLGRAYFTLASASSTPSEAVAYNNAIHWLQECVQEDPGRWYVRAHLIGAYALAGRLKEPEAKAAINAYREKFMDLSLDPAIRDWAKNQRFGGDAHADFQAAIHALLKGLEIARTEGFPP